MLIHHDNQKKIEMFFIIFIFTQPYLDVLSYFGIEISIIIRTFAMGIGLLYLLLLKNYSYKKIIISYLILLGLFFLSHTLVNYFIKNPYNIIQEVTYSIKVLFVIVMLITYSVVFLNKKNDLNIIFVAITHNMFVVSTVLAIAELTNSFNPSYSHPSKTGHTGWFFSGNDLSALMAMSFGIYMLSIFLNTNKKAKGVLYALYPYFVWAMYTIGTKVALGAVLISTMFFFLIITIRAINMKRWKEVGLALVLVCLSILYVPFSSIGFNLGLDVDSLKAKYQFDIDQAEPSFEDETSETPDPQINTNNDVDLTQRVFSGRDGFLDRVQNYWENAEPLQKVFGMGPGGNYQESLKLIEMDYFDIYYGYGILGTILIFAVYVFFALNISVKLIKSKFKYIDAVVMFISLQIILGLGIALFAGHIFLNPASGIYLAILFAILLDYVNKFSQDGGWEI